MTKLHAYVYISDAKLESLIPPDQKWWQRGRVRSVRGHAEAGLSVVKASIDADLALTEELIEKASPLGTSLKVGRVEHPIKAVATSVDDPELRAGDWIFFDGWINCHVVDIEPRPGAVLFAEIPKSLLVKGLPARSGTVGTDAVTLRGCGGRDAGGPW